MKIIKVQAFPNLSYKMNYQNLTDWKKGGLIGSCIAVLGFFVTFLFCIKLFILDGWEGISQTAGNFAGNYIGWIFLYGFMSIIIAVIVFVPLLLILSLGGFLLGWLFGKFKTRSHSPFL